MFYLLSLTYLFVAYLVGSIPVGWIIARLKGVKNIRQFGSGTIGATNVARAIGVRYFFIIFFLDALKAFLFLLLVHRFTSCLECTFICALGLLLGNTRSIFLKFGGGKGVATSVGILAALYPFILVLVFFVWLVAYAVTRIIGMASVFALLALPLFSVVLQADVYMTMFFSILSLWCVFLHRDNIKTYLAE